MELYIFSCYNYGTKGKMRGHKNELWELQDNSSI